MKTSRVAFAKHRQGYVFPIFLNVNVLDSSFVGVVQKAPTVDEYIWFYERSLAVAAVSEQCMHLLGVRDV